MLKTVETIYNGRPWCCGSIVLAVMLFLVITVSTSAAEVVLPTREPLRTKVSPKIDALLNDACWREARVIRDFCRREINAAEMS